MVMSLSGEFVGNGLESRIQYVFGGVETLRAFGFRRREAVELGITHIDTADAYGPYKSGFLLRTLTGS
jgi:hypothetical protein